MISPSSEAPVIFDPIAVGIIDRANAGKRATKDEILYLINQMDFAAILPAALKLKGKPMDVAKRRPMFRPLFARERKARKQIFICGRQIGKTASEAAAALMNLIFREQFAVLYVAPQAIYTQKFDASYLSDMISSHTLPWAIQDKRSVCNVNSKTFTSGSRFMAASMFSNPNNVLGTTADWVIVDELQGLDYDLLPFALETLGTSDFRWETYMGTARGIENTIQAVFELSSMAMWHMRCKFCGHVNIPTFEESCRMIQRAGIGCSKCSTDERPKLIDVEDGWWESQYKDRESTFMGYHVPQIIVRDRIAPYDRYFDTIYSKLKGSTMYSPARFQQEILGISSEQGGRPITPAQLKASCCLHFSEGAPAPTAEYSHIAGGADWGGSEITSFTVGTAVGRHFSGEYHVLGAVRPLGVPMDEAFLPVAAHILRLGREKLVACGGDGLFVGPIQNKHLGAQCGVPCASILYGTNKRFYTGTGGSFNVFILDKATILYIVYAMLINGKLKMPTGSWFDVFSKDLMAIAIEEVDTPNGTIRRYARIPSKADDFAHALAYALFTCALMAGESLPAMVGLAPNSSVNQGMAELIGLE